MNAKIVGLLEQGDEPMPLYAAQRIRELESEVDRVTGIIRGMCQCMLDCIPGDGPFGKECDSCVDEQKKLGDEIAKRILAALEGQGDE